MLGPIPHPRFTPGEARRARAGEGMTAGAVIPYDAVASFRITGRAGNLLQDVINISTDGVFVATAIGYGFEEDRERPLFPPQSSPLIPPGAPPIVVGDVRLGDLPLAALIEGLRINPLFANWVTGSAAGFDDAGFGTDAVPPDRVFGQLLQRIKAPEEISFLLSLVDSGTGRELQDQPAHNLASLGKSNGERPFRVLAQPLHFAPRSTLRLQVTERSEGVTGTLFVVLYGYRILGAAACPEPVARHLRGMPQCPVETIGNPDARIVPFDLVSSLTLSGRRGNQLEDELTVTAEGGFVATSIGYGLAVESRDVTLLPAAIDDVQDAALRSQLLALVDAQRRWLPGALANLGDIPLRLIGTTALRDGIRIRPDWLRLALLDNGTLATALPVEMLDSLFERLNRPEDVAFRFALFDTGTGRELQNQRVGNVAGLGIADGDRPFKRLVRPLLLLPRATLRIELEEVMGRGDVYFAFQGYKLLDRAGRSA
ncbi:MAG TPA: hypothetical protein VMN56_02540 [Casimicrobiaceae bacterium]|nr:hypothetical protein [Casimicrobiaceae bacterium]